MGENGYVVVYTSAPTTPSPLSPSPGDPETASTIQYDLEGNERTYLLGGVTERLANGVSVVGLW